MSSLFLKNFLITGIYFYFKRLSISAGEMNECMYEGMYVSFHISWQKDWTASAKLPFFPITLICN